MTNRTPARCYTSSARSLPAHVPPLEYPGHMEIRRVSSNGCISWKNALLFVTESLAGEFVALEEIGDGLWTLRFASVLLARYDERQRTLQPLPIAVKEGGSAGSAPVLTNGKNHV